MATQQIEPHADQADLNDWQTLIYRTTAQMCGKIIVGLTNMDGAGEPAMMTGSRFEINGALYKCQAGEAIGGSPASGKTNFIYAVPDGASASFIYSDETPVWSPAKGGWYQENGQNRALAKFFFIGGQYNNKVILCCHSSMSEMNVTQPEPPIVEPPDELVIEGPVNAELQVTLERGEYRYEVKGGTGGTGGSTKTDGAINGGAGAEGEYKTGIIVLDRTEVITLSAGGGGEDGQGGAGGTGDYTLSAGGGGSSGGSSYIKQGPALTAMAMGGSGGGGAARGQTAGGSNGSGGGGGGGGYGEAQPGGNATGNLFDSKGGNGGGNGIGGKGGNGTGNSGNGGGGGGYVNYGASGQYAGYGGKGYGAGGGGGARVDSSGSPVYSSAGGSGGAGSGGQGGNGPAYDGNDKRGGAGSETITMVKNIWQGGGGGAAGMIFSTITGKGGDGGGGLKPGPAFAGYAKLWRVG